MRTKWSTYVATLLVIYVGLSQTTVAQVDVFKPGPSYGLTLSTANDLGSGMYRYTGTLKYGPIRLFPQSKRIVHGAKVPKAVPDLAYHGDVANPDSSAVIRKRIGDKAESLPKVVDSVYSRYLLSISAVAGYSYIYGAPAANGLFHSSFDQSGVYGGFIVNLDQDLISLITRTGENSEWIERRGFEIRPHVGVGFTFIQAGSVNAKLNLDQFAGSSDTLTGNVVLAMPATVAVDLMLGVALTIDRKVSLILGVGLTRLVYEGVAATTIEEELKKPVSSALQQPLEMSTLDDLTRTNIMLGISFNL